MPARGRAVRAAARAPVCAAGGFGRRRPAGAGHRVRALRAGAVCLLPVSVRFCAEPDRFARAGRRRAAPAAVMAGRGPAGEPAPDHGAGGDRGDRSDRFIAGSGAAPDFVVADRRHRLSADVGRGGDQPVSARRRAVAGGDRLSHRRNRHRRRSGKAARRAGPGALAQIAGAAGALAGAALCARRRLRQRSVVAAMARSGRGPRRVRSAWLVAILSSLHRHQGACGAEHCRRDRCVRSDRGDDRAAARRRPRPGIGRRDRRVAVFPGDRTGPLVQAGPAARFHQYHHCRHRRRVRRPADPGLLADRRRRADRRARRPRRRPAPPPGQTIAPRRTPPRLRFAMAGEPSRPRPSPGSGSL